MSLSIYLTSDLCPHCGRGDEVWEANITHNLGKMAKEAGIYLVLWRHDENGIKTAGQLRGPLTRAILEMKMDPERFEKLNHPNGWGTYEHFVPWLERLLQKCEEWPEAGVRASR